MREHITVLLHAFERHVNDGNRLLEVGVSASVVEAVLQSLPFNERSVLNHLLELLLCDENAVTVALFLWTARSCGDRRNQIGIEDACESLGNGGLPYTGRTADCDEVNLVDVTWVHHDVRLRWTLIVHAGSEVGQDVSHSSVDVHGGVVECSVTFDAVGVLTKVDDELPR